MDTYDVGIYACYVLLVVTVIVAVVFPLIHILKNPKGLVKSGMGVGGLLILFIISYSLSGSEVTIKYTTMGVGESGSKFIGAGLIMFYIILIATIITMAYSEINKALK
ncbi:MAG: hypothetical protein AABY93_02290 [Bacteroidota bacterium]